MPAFGRKIVSLLVDLFTYAVAHILACCVKCTAMRLTHSLVVYASSFRRRYLSCGYAFAAATKCRPQSAGRLSSALLEVIVTTRKVGRLQVWHFPSSSAILSDAAQSAEQSVIFSPVFRFRGASVDS